MLPGNSFIIKYTLKRTLASLPVFVVAFNLVGCSLYMLSDGAEGEKSACKEKQRTFKISVDSPVKGAAVDIDNKFVGLTPQQNLPVEVNYTICKGYKEFPHKRTTTPWRITKIESHAIGVNKEGYKSYQTRLMYCGSGKTKVELDRKNFNVELKEMAQYDPSRVLFQDTFDEDHSEGWQLSPGPLKIDRGYLEVNGQGTAFIHVHDESWRNYRLEMDVFADAVGFEFHFRVADHVKIEDWLYYSNYSINLNPISQLCNDPEIPDLALYRTYNPLPQSQYIPIPADKKKLAKINGDLWNIDSPNHLVIEVTEDNISVAINGINALDYTDTQEPKLSYGGIGITWGPGNAGWIDNVIVTQL